VRRRHILGALTAACGAGLFAWRIRARRRPRPGIDLEGLVTLIAEASPAGILVAVADALAAGAPAERLLRAAALAPVLTGGDGDVHSIAVQPAIASLITRGRSPVERLLPVFLGVALAKDWTAPTIARSEPATSALDWPGERLAEALQVGDVGTADRAAAALVKVSGPTVCAAVLRFAASAERADPHGAIYAAQATRLLPGLEPRHATALLRSVARHLGRIGTPQADDPSLPRFSATDGTPATAIAEALRGSEGSLPDGLSPQAVWDALAWLAVDARVFQSEATGLSVHRTTLLDALHLTYRLAAADERALILQRAVRWISTFTSPRVRAARADRLAPAAASASVALDGPGDELAYRRALSLVAGDRAAFVDEVRRRVTLRGSGEHDYKFFAAVEALAPHHGPEVARALTASHAATWVVRAHAGWPRAAEARHLIERLT
jgi:hypothetical protein